MTDVVFMTGAKGGCGTTTCAVATGLALAEHGERTLFVDGDFSCGTGLRIADLEESCTYTLEDARRGACRVKQALVNHPRYPNFYVLPTLDCSDAEFIARAVESLIPSFDAVLCDGVAKSLCTRAIIVTEPYAYTIKSAQTAAAKLNDTGFKKTGLLVNKINGGLVFDGEILTPQEYAAVVKCELFGIVPEDLLLPLGKMKTGTKKAFDVLAERLTGKKKIFDVIKPYYGVKGKIKRKIRRCV